MTIVLRLVAISIALAGLLDPALTLTRRSKPPIAVLAADVLTDSALAEQVARELEASFTVLRAPFASAAAHVLVGTRLPARVRQIAGPAFVVVPTSSTPQIGLEAVHAPGHAPLNARVPVTATARINGAAGRRLVITLRQSDLVLDRVEREINGDRVRLAVPLHFAPTATGAALLQVTAALDGLNAQASADLLVDVSERRWSVLFFDRRPSWMSTFVRRALEQDPRFSVASRTITSRNIGTSAGAAPAALDRLAALASYDAIVVGAPEALLQSDVAGLEAYLRRRAGGVFLLLDRRADGAYERLTQISRWTSISPGTPVDLVEPAATRARLRSTELAWPARLPEGAQALAVYAASAQAQTQPVIWHSAVGPGRLVVSGALDAWKFRAADVSAFDEFWRTTIAEVAAATAPELEVSIGSTVLAPGEPTDVLVTVRDAALADPVDGRTLRTSASAVLETGIGTEPLRLWPDGPPGQLRAVLRAPADTGVHRIIVNAGGQRAEHTFAVLPRVTRPQPEEEDLLRAWAAARSGSTWPDSQLRQLRARLEQQLQPRRYRAIRHPMRSGWWILPLTLVLGLEWWWRRRRGLA